MRERTKSILSDLIMFSVILLTIASVVIIKPINSLDELWNYNFASNISKGLVPYKDFNMVQTPLLPLINSIFLMIFGNELIVMRILACFLCAGNLFMMYKILNLLNVNKGIGLFSVITVFYVLKDHFCIDYNFAVLFVLLIIIYIEIKQRMSIKKLRNINNELELNRENISILNFNIKVDLLLGILAGICIALKQSTGLIIAIVLIGYNILMVRSKKDFMIYLKIVGIRTLGVMIPLVLLLIYLLITNSFTDFWDYCVLGLKTFNNKIPYLKLFDNELDYIKVSCVLMPILIIALFILAIIKRKDVLLILTSFAIASYSVVYPIADEIHFLIGIFPGFVLLFYSLDILIKTITRKKIIEIWLKYFLIFMATGLTLWYGYEVFPEVKNYFQTEKSDLEHFSNIIVTDYTYEKIKVIESFEKVQEQTVYILDSEAALFHIPMDIYYKDYDMFLKGNLGSNGEEGQIERLEEKENIIVLIKSDGVALNWQNPNKVRDYIKNNMEYVGTVLYFDVYKKD